MSLAPGYSLSSIGTAAYTIQVPTSAPYFAPAAGTYTGCQSITLKNDTAGLSEAQKEAVEAGLADGLNRLGVTGFAGFLLSPALLGVGAGVAAGGAAAGVLLTQKKSVSPN